MSLEVSRTIQASADSVWATLMDVERWPQWTASMTSLERLDAGPLRVGSRVRIRQPSVPAMVWTVTDLQPLRGFTWSATAAGVTTLASHSLGPSADGKVSVRLAIQRRGLLAPLLDLLTASLTRRYVGLEADGLKRACEASQAATPHTPPTT